MGFSLILGTIGGMGAGDIYKGFPYKLFATLLGTMLFFSLLQQNGTLEKSFSEVDWNIAGKKTFLVPVYIYAVSFVLSQQDLALSVFSLLQCCLQYLWQSK